MLTAVENTCGTQGRLAAAARAAILRHTVIPPDQITSGCTTSTARSAMRSLKPARPVRVS